MFSQSVIARPVLTQMSNPSKDIIRILKIGNDHASQPPQYFVWIAGEMYDVRFNPELVRSGHDYRHSAVAYTVTPHGKDLILRGIKAGPIYMEEVLRSSLPIDVTILRKGIVPFDPGDFFTPSSQRVAVNSYSTFKKGASFCRQLLRSLGLF